MLCSRFKVDPFVFSDGSTVPPQSLKAVELNYNYIGTTGRAIGYTLMTLVAGPALITWAWLYRNWYTNVVRSAQPIFLIMVSVGVLLMSLSIVPMGLEETVVKNPENLDFACQAVPWLYVLGMIFAFSALYSKTYAIYQVSEMNISKLGSTPTSAHLELSSVIRHTPILRLNLFVSQPGTF